MRKRHLETKIESLALDRHKMAFISGPRQCGKTTLGRSLLRDKNLYFNWDQLKFRQQWNKDSSQIAEQALAEKHPRIVLDELHKNRRWKTQLKGFYDEYGDKIEMIITGSARLNTYRKSGDSLLGRFYHFHLHPFSLGEYLGHPPASVQEFEAAIDSKDGAFSHANRNSEVEKLFKFGGFPEPLLTAREDVHRLWQANRLELLIRQDLRDMSRIEELSQVEVLASLLPLRVGSPLSIQSLREDLEVAFTTVQRWLKFLEALYYYFEIKPYSRTISRSLKKEGKIYLYDWSSVANDGTRFENMVASHLLKICDFWTDSGLADVGLYYLRNKEKQEVDFLVVKNKKPWFTVEAKLTDLNLDQTFRVFQKQLKIPHFQIVKTDGIFRTFNLDTGVAHVISFGNFFANL